MRITGLRSSHGAHPGPRPGEPAATAPDAIIELVTDAGATGLAVLSRNAVAQAERLVAALLLDTDPRSATDAWQRMTAATSSGRPGADLQAAVAALDLALWDLKAKRNDEPLWKTLGGTRPHANVHASLSPTAPDAVTMRAAQWAQNFGLRNAKLRLGPDPGDDLDCLYALQAALGPAADSTLLAVDLDRLCSPKQSIRRARALEAKFDIAWIEGAAQDWDYPGLRQVSDAVRAAVSIGRRLTTQGEFLPHFLHRSANIVDIDIAVTGITGALMLADAAYGYELPVTLAATHGNLAAHLATVIPYFMSLEIVDPMPVTSLCRSDVHVADGRAVAGDVPGHGLRPRDDALQAGGAS